ncbi:MAG: glycosyltransferase [Paracoccaceae bacterium]
MSDPRLRLVEARQVSEPAPPRLFGRILVDAGVISNDDLKHALTIQRNVDARLGDILVAEGRASQNDVLAGLSIQSQTDRVDLTVNPPAQSMHSALPSHLCLKHEILPWRWIGDTLLVATTHPQDVRSLRDTLGDLLPPILPVVAPTAQIHTYLGRLYGDELADKAINRLPEAESARLWTSRLQRRSKLAAFAVALLCVAAILAPVTTFSVFLTWGLFTLALATGLKALAFGTQVAHNTFVKQVVEPQELPFRLPRVSVIVPLFKEEEIASHLIKRLARLTYPKSLLNVLLVLEAKDWVTRETLRRTKLPHWMSVLEVPDDGTITTKPRALNYALDFCHGPIVGVWDAEDAPEPNQIEKVVMRFHHAPDNVACLQGMLDYYNSRKNWIARCFAIEYATWWRFVMPGMSRLGLPIPLGGTTLFFRKDILENLGGWDAHNVTEDADLGVRLARRGYATELLETVTEEEANCRAWPWVRQRSRWLKGFLVTYFVHMRNPRALLRDVGLRGFLGIQVIFLATFSQFAALPLLWTFWLPIFGLPHVMDGALNGLLITSVAMFFLFSELLNILIGVSAVSSRSRRHLIPWVITLPIYFTLGALAAYKALFELVLRPFYWDKTDHGIE